MEEVTFINTLNNEGKKTDLQQRLEEGGLLQHSMLQARIQCLPLCGRIPMLRLTLCRHSPNKGCTDWLQVYRLQSALPLLFTQPCLTNAGNQATALAKVLVHVPAVLQVRRGALKRWQQFLPGRQVLQPASRRLLSGASRQKQSAWHSWQRSSAASRRHR